MCLRALPPSVTMNPKKIISPRIFWLASFLFFVSGGTGLAYQVVWFKRFSHVWASVGSGKLLSTVDGEPGDELSEAPRLL